MRLAAATVGVVVTVAAGCATDGFALDVGDCVVIEGDRDPVSGLDAVTIVDCDEPHDLEVFHTFDLAADELSGDARVDAIASACLGDAFTDYVGVPAAESPLRLLPIPPTADRVERGDREVACTLQPRDRSRTTGSVRADTTV